MGKQYGFDGKVWLLAFLLIAEGISIIFFAGAASLAIAICLMFTFGMCLKMANGATYSIVPFVNPNAIGGVAGIVGAGGNIGAMLIGFLFKSTSYSDAFFYLGCIVTFVGGIVLATKIFTKTSETHFSETIKAI
jgi:MFS transporter, NNP family, nitrate/nitrite transporter